MARKYDTTSINESLLQILSEVPGNVYWKNIKGEYEGCNNNQLKVAKLARVEDIIGKTDYDLYDKKIADAVRAIDIAVMNEGKEREIEEIGVGEDGNESVYLTKKKPLFDKSGNIVGIMGTSINITDRKRAEDLEKRKAIAEKTAKFMEMLAGSIAHELRTPLGSVAKS